MQGACRQKIRFDRFRPTTTKNQRKSPRKSPKSDAMRVKLPKTTARTPPRGIFSYEAGGGAEPPPDAPSKAILAGEIDLFVFDRFSQLAQSPRFDLADTLLRHPQFGTHLLQRQGFCPRCRPKRLMMIFCSRSSSCPRIFSTCHCRCDCDASCSNWSLRSSSLLLKISPLLVRNRSR